MALRGVSAAQLADQCPGDHEHPDQNVESVESGQHEKRGSVGAARVEPQTFIVHVIPLVGLDAEEEGTEEHSDKQPRCALFSFFHRHLGGVVGETAGNEEDGVDAGQNDRQLREIRRRRPRGRTQAQDNVAGDETGKEHGLGGKKKGHTEDRRALRGVVVGRTVVGGQGGGAHGRLFQVKNVFQTITSAQRNTAKTAIPASIRRLAWRVLASGGFIHRARTISPSKSGK